MNDNNWQVPNHYDHYVAPNSGGYVPAGIVVDNTKWVYSYEGTTEIKGGTSPEDVIKQLLKDFRITIINQFEKIGVVVDAEMLDELFMTHPPMILSESLIDILRHLKNEVLSDNEYKLVVEVLI